jgi:hypothetical protein
MKKFLKTYKKYILIGLGIGLVIGLLIWILVVNFNKNQKVELAENKPLPTPFQDNLNSFNWSLPRNSYLLSENQKVKVFTILPYKEDILNIVKKLDEQAEEVSSSDLAIFWKSSNSMITYNKDTGVLIYKVLNQLNSHPINNLEDVISFVEKLVGYKATKDKIITKKLSDGGLSYRGKYNLEDFSFGSIYLESYSFIINVSSEGNITEFSVFLYNPSSVNFYSLYSPIDSRQIVSTKKFIIKNLTWDKKYASKGSHLRVSVKLNTFDAKQLSSSYTFQDFTYGYIFPIYIVDGNAVYEDWEKTTYITETQLYILAIDGQYITKNTNFLTPPPD